MNSHSIGIELDNAGVMRRDGGRWTAWFGRTYPNQDVTVAVHKNETVERGWHRFPEVQIERALQIGGLLVERYSLEDVLGHDDIAPGRKRDPGPGFPMTAFRDALMGRAEDMAGSYATAANLNVREGPGSTFAKLPESPLAVGTRVVQRNRHGVWFQVDAMDEAGLPAVSGWVHSHYLRPA